MLEQSLDLDANDNYQNCDTTTNPGCLSTPFSVKDILNISNEEEYLSGNYKEYNYNGYNHYFQPYSWENGCYNNGYEQHNNYNNCYNATGVKTEIGLCDSAYLSQEQNIPMGNFCVSFNENEKIPIEAEYANVDSPSK